jgi:predicted negative regulator of RcsB-dependent stress response
MKVSPEFIPVIEWWEKDGKQIVALLAVAAIAYGGWYAWKTHRETVKTAASEALVNSITTAEMEEAVSRFSSEKAAGALKLRLAKSYFDEARFEEALAVLEALIRKQLVGFLAGFPALLCRSCALFALFDFLGTGLLFLL